MVQKFKFCLIFKGICLKETTTTTTKHATFTPRNIIFFIAYALDTWLRGLNSGFTLKYCLYGGAKLVKNVNPDKYVYSGCGIGFDSRLEFSLP